MIVQDVEGELVRIWGLIAELSEQLRENSTITQALRQQAETLKVYSRFYTSS